MINQKVKSNKKEKTKFGLQHDPSHYKKEKNGSSFCGSLDCSFRRDYTYIYNGNCMSCKFCYKLANPNYKKEVKSAEFLKVGHYHDPNFFLPHMTIGRYGEPFREKAIAKQCFKAHDIITSNGGKVIINSALTSKMGYDLDSFLSSIKDTNSTIFQFRCYLSDSEASKKIRDNIYSNNKFHSLSSEYRWDNLSKILDNGFEVIGLIDPVIIGLNINDIYLLIKSLHGLGIKKIIFKQLFATDFFIKYLSNLIDGKYVNLLTEKTWLYKTYKNEDILFHLYHIFELCEKLNITFSFCMNKQLNNVIGLKYNNCCLIDKPDAIFSPNKLREIIDLREINE